MTTQTESSRQHFVAESYLPSGSSPEIREVVTAVRRAARASDGEHVRLVRCIELPDDEMCSWLFEASSELAIRSVTATAALDLERVSRALERWPPQRRLARQPPSRREA